MRRVVPALLLCGCVRLPTPYTSADLAAADKAIPRAVVHYLSQPDADVDVCRLDREGPVMPASDGRVLKAIEAAAVRGDLPPDNAAGCWTHLLRTHPNAPELALSLLDWATTVVVRTPDSPLAEPLVDVVVHRPIGLEVSVDHAMRLSGRLETSSSTSAQRLYEDLQLSAGRYGGRQVDEEMLSQLSEDELVALAYRLPNRQLRQLAASRLVDVRIARSRWANVRDDPSAAERVLSTGYNAVSDDAVVVSASWDAGETGARVVRIQASPEDATARLVGARSDRELTSEPVLTLGDLSVSVVDYVEAPLVLCDADRFLSTDPCIPSRLLHLTDRYAVLDGDRVQLPTDLAIDDVVLLARSGDSFSPPLHVGGVAVADFAFGLHFDPVPSMQFSGGADLLVDVYAISNGRLLVGARVVDGDDVWSAVVPRTDSAFRVESRGRAGSTGATGSTGSQGSQGAAGATGSCYSNGGTGGSGGPGGPGGTGGTGGPGGAGGDIIVSLHCDDCEELRAFALRQVHSIGGRGGAGGSGGAGGNGGAGGRGGMGTSCTQTDAQGRTTTRTGSSGSSGSTGAHGSQGSTGAQGPPGAPGTVFIREAP